MPARQPTPSLLHAAALAAITAIGGAAVAAAETAESFVATVTVGDGLATAEATFDGCPVALERRGGMRRNAFDALTRFRLEQQAP
jgi:hypothetical protein